MSIKSAGKLPRLADAPWPTSDAPTAEPHGHDIAPLKDKLRAAPKRVASGDDVVDVASTPRRAALPDAPNLLGRIMQLPGEIRHQIYAEVGKDFESMRMIGHRPMVDETREWSEARADARRASWKFEPARSIDAFESALYRCAPSQRNDLIFEFALRAAYVDAHAHPDVQQFVDGRVDRMVQSIKAKFPADQHDRVSSLELPGASSRDRLAMLYQASTPDERETLIDSVAAGERRNANYRSNGIRDDCRYMAESRLLETICHSDLVRGLVRDGADARSVADQFHIEPVPLTLRDSPPAAGTGSSAVTPMDPGCDPAPESQVRSLVDRPPVRPIGPPLVRDYFLADMAREYPGSVRVDAPN